MKHFFWGSCFALALGLVNPAMADTTLRFLDQNQKQSLVQTKDGLVRVEQAGNQSVFMLFDVKQDVLTVVNNADKTYQRINQARIEQAAKKIAAAKEKLRANFEKLSPEQQAQLQPMIERMAVAEVREQRIEKGAAGSVSGVACTHFQLYENDKATQKLCAADAKGLNVSQADYDAIAGMLVMLADLSNKMGGGMMQTAISPEDIDGIPVSTGESQTNRLTKLHKVDGKQLDASRFVVPAGYVETQPQ